MYRKFLSRNLSGLKDLIPKHTQLFIGGKWIDSFEGNTFPVVNPATGKVLCEVQEAREKDVDFAVACAREAYPKWRDCAPGYKSEILHKFADLLEENLDEVASVESLNSGKPFLEARNVDCALTIQQFRYFAGFADKIEGKTVESPGDFLNFTLEEPLGVCAGIVPWNFPILMFAWKVAPALCTGNTMVLKTSSNTPLSALYCAELFRQAGLPEGVLNVISGFGSPAGDYLARHMDVDKVSFTGSTDVGRNMYIASGESNLKCVSLELGGKSPMIVMPDMIDDLETAVATVMNGIFFNKGEVCCASSRVFVHEDIHEEFLKCAKEFCEARIVGDPFDANTHQGSQNNRAQYEKVLSYVQIGKEEATLLCGGNPIGDGSEGLFIEPTVFYDVDDDMTIAEEEIFGPVISVLKFKDVDEVIHRANDTCYGLAAGVMTHDLDLGLKVAKKLEAGTVWVNCWNIFDANLGFGGYKMSGHGKDSSSYALKNFLQSKVVTISVPGLKEKY